MGLSDCIFCRIAAKQASADILYQDEDITAFWDKRPAAPLHILIIPNKHIPSVNELEPGDAEVLGKLMLCAKNLAGEAGFAERGYRLVVNVGLEGGQTIYHLHLHLIAGKRLPLFHD